MINSDTKPLALVTGVGPGTGTALARRFAEGGYRVAMLARNASRLSELEKELPDSIAVPCDVTDAAMLAKIIPNIGNPKVVVHNAVGGAFGNFLDTDAATLQRNFEINTMALMNLAKLTAPAMIAAGEGALVITGNSLRTARQVALRRLCADEGRAADTSRVACPRSRAQRGTRRLSHHRRGDRRTVAARTSPQCGG